MAPSFENLPNEDHHSRICHVCPVGLSPGCASSNFRYIPLELETQAAYLPACIRTVPHLYPICPIPLPPELGLWYSSAVSLIHTLSSSRRPLLTRAFNCWGQAACQCVSIHTKFRPGYTLPQILGARLSPRRRRTPARRCPAPYTRASWSPAAASRGTRSW